jgi:hypothetical protein
MKGMKVGMVMVGGGGHAPGSAEVLGGYAAPVLLPLG